MRIRRDTAGGGSGSLADSRCEFDVTSRVAVLGGVRQEVRKDLRQAEVIDFQPHRFDRQTNFQMLVLPTELRPHRFDRGIDDRDEGQGLLPELKLAFGDARDVQQVVQQQGHVPDLPFNDQLRLVPL